MGGANLINFWKYKAKRLPKQNMITPVTGELNSSESISNDLLISFL